MGLAISMRLFPFTARATPPADPRVGDLHAAISHPAAARPEVGPPQAPVRGSRVLPRHGGPSRAGLPGRESTPLLGVYYRLRDRVPLGLPGQENDRNAIIANRHKRGAARPDAMNESFLPERPQAPQVLLLDAARRLRSGTKRRPVPHARAAQTWLEPIARGARQLGLNGPAAPSARGNRQPV